MKKTAVSLLCCALICAAPVSASAAAPDSYSENAVLSTSVPLDHLIRFRVTGNVEFKLDGKTGSEFTVGRQSEPLLEIIPKAGEKITSVTVNGEDMTDKLENNSYRFPPVYEDKEIIVEVKTENTAEPNSSPKTGAIGGTTLAAAALLGAVVFAKMRKTEN